MKKTLILSFIALLSINCSNDSESDISETPVGNDVIEEGGETPKLTYTNDIATIVNNNCLECHGATPRNGAPTSFNTFDLVESAASSMNSRMNNSSRPMPTSGLLPLSTREKFTQWITDGKLE